MNDEVLIIGGGYAGLAAGVALAQVGRRVRLLEQKPYLGGRARSFTDAVTGSVVDNGQHLFMGCYHQTIDFLKTIGTLDRLSFQPGLSVRFLESDGNLSSLQCPQISAPWNLLLGLLRSDSFTWSEKLEVARMRRAMGVAHGSVVGGACGTVDEWMKSMGQSESLRHKFWNLICIAAMNEDPQIASAELFALVLKLALFTSASDSRLGMARVGLSECYTAAATEFISARGGRVELGKNVVAFNFSHGACRGVTLAGGDTIEAKVVLSAAPWNQFVHLVPSDVLESETFFSDLAALQPAPIISINLWFDKPVTDLAFAALRGTTIQWLFNRNVICPQPESGKSGSELFYISLVLSGAHAHIEREKEDLLAMALEDLRGLLPASSEARLVHSLVLKERFATFSPAVGVVKIRPPARTPIRGLYLAGDWTATGLPATIEGAVKSGYTAASEILETT